MQRYYPCAGVVSRSRLPVGPARPPRNCCDEYSRNGSLPDEPINANGLLPVEAESGLELLSRGVSLPPNATTESWSLGSYLVAAAAAANSGPRDKTTPAGSSPAALISAHI